MQYEIQIKKPNAPWQRFSTYKTLSNAKRYLALYQRQSGHLAQFRLIDLGFRLQMQ